MKESPIDKAAIEILEKNLENIYRRGSVTSTFMNHEQQMYRQLNQRNLSLPNIHFPYEHIYKQANQQSEKLEMQALENMQEDAQSSNFQQTANWHGTGASDASPSNIDSRQRQQSIVSIQRMISNRANSLASSQEV